MMPFADIVTTAEGGALGPMVDLVGNLAWVLGLAMAANGIWRLRRFGVPSHLRRSRASYSFFLFVGAACLIAFPSFVGIGPASVFGTDATTAEIGGELRSLE